MTNRNITRRQCLLGACGLGLGAALNVKAESPLINQSINTEPYPRNADEALKRLKAGNQRFMDDKPLHDRQESSWRSLLVETQKPFATILGCSDSRVPPELIFDVGFGELFTVRVAGNVIAEDVIGSLQYAVRHLRTSLVVVLGHEKCGAVSATIEEMINRPTEPEHIGSLIQLIKPGLTSLSMEAHKAGVDKEALVSAAVEANVRWSMHQLVTLPAAVKAMREGRGATLMGGIYELETGRVRFLS
ncbi:carbonic anhydrase [Nitrosomonas sp. Nm84]|uniref:carbonic anhydrase n=1 Tax=Nitrosomonas sp. Nm84 TaxID=200124 RepID=UPI000D75FC81|nr:carbonic anhydrase [Nitrosomonas sp. Nm84]PXW86732.1 carbonic anhydrase [Nitrosomonas sp. Nm84]